MRPGTPGFVGQRLREAREARGLSPQQLGEMLGVSKQAISQYEIGPHTPRPDVMDRLPDILNVKSRFFFSMRPEDSPEPLFFRSLAAASRSARLRAKRREEWLFDVIRFVQHFVSLPDVRIPSLPVPANPLDLTPDDLEAAAQSLRRYWNLGDGVISDLVLLLENNGVIVSRGELWCPSLDAFSRWRDGRPFIFLSADKESAARSRMDLAHELAHIVLHRGVTAEMLADRAIFKRLEDQAFYFAGAFLLPRGSFMAQVAAPSLELFRALKPTWGVSIKAMMMRSIQLGVLESDTQYWRSYSRRGWNRQEPFDAETVPERPRVLRRAFELMVQGGVFVVEQLAQQFDFAATDLEALAGLEPGFLNPKLPQVRLLDFSRRERNTLPSDLGTSMGSAILPFPTRRTAE